MASRKFDNPHSGDGASPGFALFSLCSLSSFSLSRFASHFPLFHAAKSSSEETFVKYFEKYGEITDSVIMKDRHTGRPRGFGFITYADPSVVDQVIQENHVVNGKQVEIKRTIPKGSSQANDFKTKKIFVGGIPTSVSEDELKNFFSKYGKVVEHEIIRDHTTKRSRGFGFIVFDSEKVVDNILADGNMIDMGGTQVSCVWYFRMFDVFETGNANYKGAVCFKDDGFGSERILLCHNVEIKKAEPKKSSNPASLPPFASDSRARSYNDGFGGFGDSYGSFGGSGYGPGSYRSLGGFGGRLGDYGGYGAGDEFGGSFGGYGGAGAGGYAGFRGESSFGYSSRYGSYMGGLGAGYGGSGLGAYGRGGGAYGTYGGPSAGGGYESGPGAGYGGAGGGMYPSRGSYGGSSRYHPYAR
ncbi:hypothetical protein JHK84_035382 [Glycine max]|nr:hypothetical protein JHK84_035382 [Glycine max]